MKGRVVMLQFSGNFSDSTKIKKEDIEIITIRSSLVPNTLMVSFSCESDVEKITNNTLKGVFTSMLVAISPDFANIVEENASMWVRTDDGEEEHLMVAYFLSEEEQKTILMCIQEKVAKENITLSKVALDPKLIPIDSLPGWYWNCYSDRSGSLNGPEGQHFFEYDLNTRKYKYPQMGYRWASCKNSYKYKDFSVFKEEAEAWVLLNVVGIATAAESMGK